MNLSVVIAARNEAGEITDCLKSVEKLADEIILVDNESTDDTAKMAHKLGAKVYPYKNDPLYLNLSKNFGFTKAKGDWTLSLDADERVSPRPGGGPPARRGGEGPSGSRHAGADPATRRGSRARHERRTRHGRESTQ